MNKGMGLKRFTAAGVLLLVTIAMIGIILACATHSRAPFPGSPWGDKFFYSYDPPESTPARLLKVSVAIVAPEYPQKVDALFSKVAKGLAASTATDLERILLARGMTVTGPYDSLESMTYPEKKNVDLILTPQIFINPQLRYTSWTHDADKGWAERSAVLKVDVWMVLVVREALSTEKLWIKKVEVGEMTETARMIAESNFYGGNYQVGRLGYDGRPDALADIIKKMYPKLMNTVWNYLEPKEMVMLKEKALEIRRTKRF